MAETTEQDLQPEPQADPIPAADAPDPAPAPEPADPPKPKDNGAAYEARKARERSAALEKELEGYKRREEDARKAKLTEHERLTEDLKIAQQKVERLEAKALQDRVAAEFKLPAALAARLIGTNEDALRADAEELSKLIARPRVGSATDPVRDGGGKPRVYTRSELQADPKLARSAEVAAAAREGRIVAG